MSSFAGWGVVLFLGFWKVGCSWDQAPHLWDWQDGAGAAGCLPSLERGSKHPGSSRIRPSVPVDSKSGGIEVGSGCTIELSWVCPCQGHIETSHHSLIAMASCIHASLVPAYGA